MMIWFKPLSWHISICTSTGGYRELNEDAISYYQTAQNSFAIVCDGVGGANAGEIASQTACDILSIALKESPIVDSDDLKQRLLLVHECLLAKGEEETELKGMATTMVAAVQQGKKALVAWAGDSRCYFYSPKSGLTQLTCDHSFVNDKVIQGILTQEEAEQHPMANLITSVLGGSHKKNRIDVVEQKLKKGQYLLLVSDGVSGYVDTNQMEKTVPQGAREIVDLALKASTRDNCSAIVISCV